MDYQSARWRFIDSMLIDCKRALLAIFSERKIGVKHGISKNRK